MTLPLAHPATELCRVMNRIYDMDMTTMSGGNLSIRDSEGVIWITPAAIDKASLKPADIVQLLPDGSVAGRHKPTSESNIHRTILDHRPDLTAIVHAHPPAAVTMSILQRQPRLDLYPIRNLSRPQFTAYAPPGTMALVDSVMTAFNNGADASTLDKHGLFVGSPHSLMDGFYRFEALDFAARVEIAAHSLGTLRPLTETQLALKPFSGGEALRPLAPQSRTSREMALREELCALAARAYQKKLFTSQEGVISARIEGDSFLILPWQRDNATLRPEDILRIDGDCREEGPLPDETVLFHQQVYRTHPQQNAIIMARPVYSTAFAVTEALYHDNLYPESYYVLRGSRRYPFNALQNNGKAIAKELTTRYPVALVENMGLIIAAERLGLTFDRLEVAESGALSCHQILQLGHQPLYMTQEQNQEMDRLLNRPY